MPEKIHPEDLNLNFGKFSESKATADKKIKSLFQCFNTQDDT
ncbi:hypothetical protein M717_10305 [Neisseria gonorrhoeae SK33414]|uniref:Uncharacterized protein n=2 Tax=Neisseria gonorrhoeae TaxID=485 RepID=A0AA44U9Y9_NEIGO|nr:Hypothetical protein NGK_1511 [Neisseria gonorrhoeae NCCP11945]APW53841.1 hypothetical protein T556_08505 [Neisseria gonorrhoeae NG-k51.05]EFE04637.1 conserved hypothetical protein [Neisseria gonorrhoeae DGI2]KLR76010.1 hypothetical protein M717_10305 [Neisseria gonorrhoeae SK33414]KLR81779.1 hypothetical protein M680_05390 [Neisseria gonorrhoeae SK8976]KLR82553.1 hypothetical protein M679_06100 [Neisseria gonorrhoeae SK7842]KLR84972.1 hypothetical protein M684_01345 [Neisseria gonorrhoeae